MTIMLSNKRLSLKKLNEGYERIKDYEEVSLPPILVIAKTATLMQIPQGCKQRFKANRFLARGAVDGIVKSINHSLGRSEFITRSIPGTLSSEYYVAHLSEKDIKERK